MNPFQQYLELKEGYRYFDTKESLRRMQVLRSITLNSGENGRQIAFDMLGSINFGIVEENSDIDLVLYHSCDSHNEEHASGEDCPLILGIKDTVEAEVRKNLGDVKIEFLDILNLTTLKTVSHSIPSAWPENDQVVRFLFYRLIGRPVNRPLLHGLLHKFTQNPELMDRFDALGSDFMEYFLKTGSHQHSFYKYNERIKNQGLALPWKLKQDFNNYLNIKS